ncbi:MAG TPA: ankyrin repeat domain-containing protein [Terracidiphilus sp.]|nr:ankyrin repeat domain-containing protein [Terracidiphilus sp.]
MKSYDAGMILALMVLGVSATAAQATAPQKAAPAYPYFDYDAAQKHEVKPHRRTIPLDGVEEGENQLHLILIVSADGKVIKANAESGTGSMKFWPTVRDEVMQWTFTPFEVNRKPTNAKVEEYVDLVPPERMPTRHVPGPPVRPNSNVTITLERTGCFGSCPSYTVRVSTNGIQFDGEGYVVAPGKHMAKADPVAVRDLAKKFIADNFYSMDPAYRAAVTDNPAYVLSIDVDGHAWKVYDYVGSWVGMPEVISELEDDVDSFAQTKRWIEGTDGLVDALKAEGFNFKSYEAQMILKEASSRGQTETVQELLDAGVPLKPIAPPKPRSPDEEPLFANVGWLNAASPHPETLKVLLDSGAGEGDQSDLNMALLNAARAGKLASVKELIDAGADPNAGFSKQLDEQSSGGMTLSEVGGAGSVLIGAATSGNPDVVREILRFHLDLEVRDRQGDTAVIAASKDNSHATEEERAECVRLLVEAGANVNARNRHGNTALHETFLTAVEKELLKLGANVNARNNDGETPIFTTVDDDAIALYIQHGANLAIRNNKGQTAMEAAASDHGPLRVKAFQDALRNLQKHR